MKNHNLDISFLKKKARRMASRIFFEILEENKKLGIATPVGIAGKIYFIMPDGKILTEEEYLKNKEAPEESQKKKFK